MSTNKNVTGVLAAMASCVLRGFHFATISVIRANIDYAPLVGL